VDEDIVAWTFNFMPLISARSAGAKREERRDRVGQRRKNCKWGSTKIFAISEQKPLKVSPKNNALKV